METLVIYYYNKKNQTQNPQTCFLKSANFPFIVQFCLGKEDIDIAYSDHMPKDLVQSVSKYFVAK